MKTKGGNSSGFCGTTDLAQPTPAFCSVCHALAYAASAAWWKSKPTWTHLPRPVNPPSLTLTDRAVWRLSSVCQSRR